MLKAPLKAMLRSQHRLPAPPEQGPGCSTWAGLLRVAATGHQQLSALQLTICLHEPPWALVPLQHCSPFCSHCVTLPLTDMLALVS